ncbi:MAG: phenylalanine--tRNA ligase subunit beta, partial [Rhodospirillales bacterium]|nr:phenylalanine--tRNA ligase subunit beta [Rhodospirillales bacterium]
MKFTLSWLKTHLETDASLDDIAAKLTAIGLEVEGVRRPGDDLAPFTVAYVVEARQHPNADKLRLCTVDTGKYQVEVVCGAPNARTGMKGVFAPPGTTIPGTGVVLKKAKIRGVESCGMLCSEREMGLSDEHEGIIELDPDAPVGAPFADVIGLDDPLFDIAITPNRADCLGVYGVARDLAAAGLGRLKSAGIEPVAGTFASPIDVILDFPVDGPSPCPLFLGRFIRGVRNCESPRWLKDRLSSVGLRPISALVDLTNFLTIDRNRPVHVFDAGKVKGDIWLRLGQGGATFAALNGKEYVLDDVMTGIGDESGVISLAGVMGGEPTGCTMETTDVFIEIALFDPVRTAATGRTFNLESDARYRFERGVDPAFAGPGMELMTRLVMELCGGEASEIVVAGAEPAWRREIAFRPSRVKALGGVDCAQDDSLGILTALGFGCEEKEADPVAVRPPSWRGDILGEADLVEEVLRIAGFDQIPAVSLSPTAAERARPALSPTRRRLGAVRRSLTARGMFEVVTWSFMPRQHAALFGDAPDALVLANPINAELDAMRPSILSNLNEACRRNADRGFAGAALFETGPVYSGTAPEEQRTVVAGVRAAAAVPRNWHGPERQVDPFDAKADALAALSAAGVSLG